MQRLPTTAMADLIGVTNDLQIHLEELATAYPLVIGFGAVVAGRVRGVFALTASLDGDHWSYEIAEDRARCWAQILGNMPDNMVAAFEIEWAVVKANRRPEEG